MNWTHYWDTDTSAASTSSATLAFGLDGETVTMRYQPRPRCQRDGYHTIRFLHARGSNAHARREHGKCEYCGKHYTRTIRWAEKDAQWWEPVEEAA